MSSKPKSNNVNSLLAAIQRKAPTNTMATPEPAPTPATAAVAVAEPETPRKTARRAAAPAAPKGRVGKPVQFWLHDEDRQMVRELAAWLAGQGLRPTDSMVIRSALRTAKTGGDLLEAYRQAAQLDGRLKQHKPSEAV
jgi:hypothetical protein